MTEDGQAWEIDLTGRRLRSWDMKGETDGWDDYKDCSIPCIGSQVHVTLEAGLVLTIDRLAEIDSVSSADKEFLTKLAEDLKSNTPQSC